MAKKGLKIFGFGVGGLLIVAGIIVGILFASGIIKVPSKNAPEDSPPRDPLNPVAPNPNEKQEINVRLSNPKLSYGGGGGYNLPIGITYNLEYDPSPFKIGAVNWELKSNVVLIFKSGRREVLNKTDVGTIHTNTYIWQDFINGLGIKEVPSRAELSANVSYRNKYGNTVTGSESNRISVDIPSNY